MSLEFGTAGIRGIVGTTKNNINEAHAAQIFEALAKYINAKFKNKKNKSVVIGRDNRKLGKKISIIATNILTSNGIKVYYNENMIPTPYVSFLIKHKKALAGINITASHNPKEYNGIKLYNEFGYQMLPNEINEVKKYFEKYEKYEFLINKNISLVPSNLILKTSNNDFDFYIDILINSLYNQKIDLSNLKIIYSPLHGTGYKYAKKIFDKLNIKVIYEKNEIKEDENFTFVKNPNPESELAYINSYNLAIKEEADLIIITDPDSDRLGVGFIENKKLKLINGNENAILITDFLLANKKMNNNLPYYLIYSFVSTSLPEAMCKKNNIKSYITETGFKWIGKKIEDKKNKENLFFAFEESYGSLINEEISLDKDAFQSIVIILMIASLAKKQSKNLNDKLNEIYSDFGFMESRSFSFDLQNENQLKQIKEKFKNVKFENVEFIDYSKKIGDIEPNDMLLFKFKNSLNWISLRPSGTEPKFKIYIHIVEKSKEKAIDLLNKLFIKIKTELNI